MTELLQGLVGTSTFVEGAIGFEEVTRAAHVIMIQELNDALDTENERWKKADLELQELMGGEGVGQIDIEPIPLPNFHEGPHPSFLEAPPVFFPNVSVMAYAIQPDATNLFDQVDEVGMRLFIETIVKAGPVPEGSEAEFETIVHRRIERSTEAVHAVIRNNRTLRNTVQSIDRPPRGGIGQSWLRKEDKGRGPRWLMHGSRLEYQLQRVIRF